ncbi:hypothetical protein BpHYR1_018916 [Brachionus plicatilis]|uniref:Uncharacterized protein n=1 Tax=Brachionus plicatilis TaxID=10195 RepID=A0A3M7S7E4_BRAPC|nr:hypothetical protein BpHYR1_018916 [Brachionus plicatilis]
MRPISKIPTEEIKKAIDSLTSRHLDQYIHKNEKPNFAYLVIYDCKVIAKGIKNKYVYIKIGKIQTFEDIFGQKKHELNSIFWGCEVDFNSIISVQKNLNNLFTKKEIIYFYKIKISLQNTLQFCAFCTPLKKAYLNSKNVVVLAFTIKFKKKIQIKNSKLILRTKKVGLFLKIFKVYHKGDHLHRTTTPSGDTCRNWLESTETRVNLSKVNGCVRRIRIDGV